MEGLGFRVEMTVDDIGRDDVGRVWIRIAKEVGQSDGGERVVVSVGAVVEFHHLERLRIFDGNVGREEMDLRKKGGGMDDRFCATPAFQFVLPSHDGRTTSGADRPTA